jgi:hypothetical protein
MKARNIFVIVALVATLMTASAATGLQTIKLVGTDTYVVVVQDGRLIGGYVRGSSDWKIVGGAYDGKNLTVIQQRDGTDSGKWMTVHFKLDGERGIATTKMNNEGETISLRSEYRATVQAEESAELAAARAELRELRLRYKDKHPAVQRTLSKIAELEAR